MSNDVIDAILNDEHAGNGGSYVYDPETGKRTLADDEQPLKPLTVIDVFRELVEKE